jgi:hypothetical protein
MRNQSQHEIGGFHKGRLVRCTLLFTVLESATFEILRVGLKISFIIITFFK